jgi:uncharacterized protein YutE (UPF0331/DUF86 family)
LIGRYAVLASQIQRDLDDLERVVERVEQAVQAARADTAQSALFIDAAPLNLHDLYSSLERVFTHIASGLDQSVPSGPDWHRELLRQMSVEVNELRPPVISAETARELDEFMRFRRVVRHAYAFDLEADRVEQLSNRLRPAFQQVQQDLRDFVAFLNRLAGAG